MEFDELFESMVKCRRGVSWKQSVAHFTLNAMESVMKLTKEANYGYESSNPFTFRITSPKPRDILSVRFRDRVYQRCLNDNIIYPTMSKRFIYDNCACQIGKGTDFARRRLKIHIQREFRKYGIDLHVLQLDIKGYYPNMSHYYAESLFKRDLDSGTYQRVIEVLHKQYQTEKGYNAGSQLIQIAGIACLDGLDHFIKETLRARRYVRYMDDMVLISHDREYLESGLAAIKQELMKIGLEVNTKKTKVYPISKGIPFLGFKFKLTPTGKIMMLMNPSSIKRERRHLRGMMRRYDIGRMSIKDVGEAFECWKAHASKGNSKRLIAKMERFYKEMKNENHKKQHDVIRKEKACQRRGKRNARR